MIKYINEKGIIIEIGTGVKYLFNGYIIELTHKNTNGTYSAIPYKDNGKKGSRFSLLKDDLEKIKNI